MSRLYVSWPKTKEELIEVFEKRGATILRDGEKVVIINPDYLNDELTTWENEFDGEPDKKSDGYSIKNKEALKRLADTRNIIEKIKEDEDLISKIPVTKSGHFSKNPIPLYDTGISSVINEEYFSKGELFVELRNTSRQVWGDTELLTVGTFPDLVFVDIELSNPDRKIKPLFDKDYNQVSDGSITRQSYLKRDELEIGKSYLDKKGREFLYLCDMKHFTKNAETVNSKPVPSWRLGDQLCHNDFENIPFFIKMDKKHQKMYEDAANIKQFINDLVLTGNIEGWGEFGEIYLADSKTSQKYRSEVKTYFSSADAKCIKVENETMEYDYDIYHTVVTYSYETV